MVNIIKRMRKLRQLLWIRVGPGALILPKEVSKISLEFNAYINGGHRGARKFWREMLPRIKYRNPAIPIQISRHKDPLGPARLNIYTTSSKPAAVTAPEEPQQSRDTPPSSTPNTSEPTHTIDIRMTAESEILAQLISRTGATIIGPTPEEEEELAEIAEFKKRSSADRAEVREKLLQERKEAEMLKLARGEMVAAN